SMRELFSAREAESSRLQITSATPKRPSAIATKLTPSESSIMPNVMRAAPVFTSMPIMPRSSPRKIMASALISDPLASTTAATRPNTISEKYSGEVNCCASLASGGPAKAMISVPEQPATTEPMAAIASASPALPCCAILYPSMADQDRGGRAAILRAVIDARKHDDCARRVEREGDRHQKRDRRDRPKAGQNTNQRTENGAEQAEEQVLWRENDGQTVGEETEGFHHGRRSTGILSRPTNTPAERTASTAPKMTLW